MTGRGFSHDGNASNSYKEETAHGAAEDMSSDASSSHIEAGSVPREDDTAPLEKTTSRKSMQQTVPTASVNDTSSIPDGGLISWLQVLGSFFLFFNSWGIVNSYGVMQTYYMETLLRDSTPSAIAWIGSVQSFCLGFIGPATGPLYDAGYFRALIITGSFLVVFGHMMLSLATEYWQVFLSQAICVGLGASCLFIPSVAILSTYFSKNLATAVGLSASGSSLGGVIYPIVVYRLIPQIGFPWAVRVIAFISLATLSVSIFVMRVRVLPASKRKIVDLPSFTEPPYVLFITGGFLSFMGLYSVLVYVESYALDYKILDQNMSFYSLAVINGVSVLGRIIPNFIADRTGPLNIMYPATFMSGVLALCLIPARRAGPLLTVDALYGFFSGALVSLPPTVFVSLSQHKRALIGTRMGSGFLFFSIGLLVGTPISGVILAAGTYTHVWIFGGVLLLVASGFFFAARAAKLHSLNLLTNA